MSPKILIHNHFAHLPLYYVSISFLSHIKRKSPTTSYD